MVAPLFSIRDVSDAVGRTRKTILRWEKAGRIPVAQRVGGKRRYSSSDIRRILELTAKPVLRVDDPPEHLDVPFDVEDMTTSFSAEKPETRPWAVLEAGDRAWPTPTGRDAKGQPIPSGPACPICSKPVHQVTVHDELIWVCGEHGLVNPIVGATPSPAFSGGSFPVYQPAIPPRRRGLLPSDIQGAIRIPKAVPPPYQPPLDPHEGPTRPQ